MPTKRLCVLIHIRTSAELGTAKHVKVPSHFLTDPSELVLLLWVLIKVLCLSLLCLAVLQHVS